MLDSINTLPDNMVFTSPNILNKAKMVGSTVYLGHLNIPIGTTTITAVSDIAESNIVGFYGYATIYEEQTIAVLCVTSSTNEEIPVGTYFRQLSPVVYITGISCATKITTAKNINYIDENIVPKLILNDTAEIIKLLYADSEAEDTLQQHINEICTEAGATPITLTADMITASGISHDKCIELIERGEPLNVYIRTDCGLLFNYFSGFGADYPLVSEIKPFRVETRTDNDTGATSKDIYIFYHPIKSPFPNAVDPEKVFCIQWHSDGTFSFDTSVIENTYKSFCAIYGKTSYYEIVNAVENNRQVYCRYEGTDSVVYIPLVSISNICATFEVHAISNKYDVYGNQVTVNNSDIWNQAELVADIHTKQPRIHIATSRPTDIVTNTIWYKEQV